VVFWGTAKGAIYFYFPPSEEIRGGRFSICKSEGAHLRIGKIRGGRNSAILSLPFGMVKEIGSS